MNATQYIAFENELEKIAKAGILRRQLSGLVGGPGLKAGEETVIQAALRALLSPRKAMKRGLKDMPGWEKALLAGFTGYQLPAAIKRGQGDRPKRIGKLLGGTAGWLAFRRMPIAGLLAGWYGAEHVGGKAGAAAGRKIRGY
jgi:hypothetical protein